MSKAIFEEYKIPDLAINYLADCLKEGTLIMFLGAGASKSYGLPSWVELVNDLRSQAKMDLLDINCSSEDLQNAADEVKSKLKDSNDNFINRIEKSLYKNISSTSIHNIFSNKLLIALSSLLMGSKRGHIRKVVTFNYDSMLEWFVTIFGFVANTIYKLPDLEGNEDITIYHPNGFIPHVDLKLEKSETLIFGMESVNNRIGQRDEIWFQKIRNILESGISLFIGMSIKTLTDRAFEPLLTAVNQNINGSRPVGIWLLMDKIETRDEIKFERNNVVPIEFETEEEITEFIFKVSQKASEIS